MLEKSKRRRAVLFLTFILGVPAWFFGVIRWPNPKLGERLVPYAEVENPFLMEVSGLVQSRTDPKVFWAHNDSGNAARLFTFEANGKTLQDPTGLPVEEANLVDWEDITAIGDRLYVSDMGNNFNNRRDLGVYEISEPKLGQSPQARADAFFPVSYPDQTGFPPLSAWNFDCEATFAWNDRLYFVTKSRPSFRIGVQGHQAGLYRLDTRHTDRVNELTKVDQVEDLGGWVTSADTSHDGRYLAVLVESPVQSVWLYERPAQGDRFFSEAVSTRRHIFHGGGQLEALAFHRLTDGSEEIVLLNEDRQLFRLSLTALLKLNSTHQTTGNELTEPNSKR